MMTAKEAYELTNENIKITTEEHFKQMEKGIRERANKGEYDIILRVSDTISQSIRDYMVQQLKLMVIQLQILQLRLLLFLILQPVLVLRLQCSSLLYQSMNLFHV